LGKRGHGSVKERTTTKPRGLWIATAALCAALLTILAPRAFAQSVGNQANMTIQWHGQAIVNVTLTPNFHTGWGTVPATIGAQPTPSPGPNARCGVGCGDIDFGQVGQGNSYLYKYAVDVHATSNDPTGLDVYGEGAADFQTQVDGNTIPISSSLYWLNGTNGTDSNTGFSPSIAFQKTGGLVTGSGFATPPTIAYAVYPSPISSSSTGNADFYYDYQIKVPFNAAVDNYYVWVVYTVVGR
jgi:hypothetical protein